MQLSESFRLKLIFLCVCTFLKLRRHWQTLLWISHWLNRNIPPICNKLSIPHHDNPNITRQIQVNQHLHLAVQRWSTTHKPPTNVKCSVAATCVSYLTLIQMKWVAQKKLLEILAPDVQKLERECLFMLAADGWVICSSQVFSWLDISGSRNTGWNPLLIATSKLTQSSFQIIVDERCCSRESCLKKVQGLWLPLITQTSCKIIKY